MSAFAPEERPLIECVYVKNEATLRKLALKRLNSEELAEEVIQIAADRFMNSFDKIVYLSENDLRGYFYKIVLNTITDMLNHNTKEIPVDEVPRNHSALDNVEEFVLGKYGAQMLYEKIKQLPPRYGMYIEMAYIDKLPAKVIATALGVEVNSLREIARRAKRRLAELCKEESEVR